MIPRAEFAEAKIITAPRPDLRAAPGQFFLAVPPTFDPYLPHVVFPFRLRGEFVESLILPLAAAAWVHDGDLELRGAYGKGFELPSHTVRVLVLAQDALTGAQLLPLIDILVARDCEVAALGGSNDVMDRWLPPEVEYRTAEDVLSATSELWSWADVVYACGTMSFYDQLRRVASSNSYKFERGKVQILLHDLPMPCGTGICYACALRTTRGVVLTCQDGPVFDLAEWIVEE